MRRWTLGEARAKVLRDMDMTDELFVTPDEILGYFNEAIDEAEAEIMKIHEDYFLTNTQPTLISGTASYDLPDDIYAQKIRALIYQSGDRIYQAHRIRNFNKFLNITEADYNPNSTQEYQFYIKNPDITTGYQLVLSPPAQEDGTPLTLWYIRNASRVVDDEDIIDIPEFANFVMTYVKAMCAAKENGGDMPPVWASRVQQQREMMVSTLTGMVPDDEDTVDGDFSHYMEHS